MNVRTTNHTIRLLILLLLAVCTGAVSAQPDEAEHPFLRLLANVPDNAAVHESFSYVDYRAITAAREGAPTITTVAEFAALNADESPERDLFWAAYFGISSGPHDFLSYLMQIAERMLQVTGIDPFTVERALNYGSPPGAVDVYFGEFSPAQIAIVHSLRDYVENTVHGLTLWCGNEECDGARVDVRSRDPGNPFGGNLGRRQAVLVGDNLVASSASTERLEQIAEAISGNTDTLADNPDYRAAAEAITQEGLLRQTYFIAPSTIPSLTDAAIAQLFGSRMSASDIEAYLTDLIENFTPIPPYRLLAIADTATEDDQIALVALVYNDAENAEAAAEALTQRIENYESLVTSQPLRDILEDRGLTSIDTDFYESNERVVLLLHLHAAHPPAEPEGDSDRLVSSSLLFRALLNMYIQRDLAWLAPLP